MGFDTIEINLVLDFFPFFVIFFYSEPSLSAESGLLSSGLKFITWIYFEHIPTHFFIWKKCTRGLKFGMQSLHDVWDPY